MICDRQTEGSFKPDIYYKYLSMLICSEIVLSILSSPGRSPEELMHYPRRRRRRWLAVGVGFYIYAKGF